MNNLVPIRYIKNAEIDFEKWDACVSKASNGLIYAFSWYLDRVSKNWDALVFGDYENVMPLTFNKKWGIEYLCQPTYCQQLGIFPGAGREIADSFLKEVKTHFRFAEINLNPQSFSGGKIPGMSEKQNFILSLSKKYDGLEKGFSSHTARHLKKAVKNKLNVSVALDIEEYITFKLQNQNIKAFRDSAENLRKLISFLIPGGKCKIYGVHDSGSRLCAAAIFVFTGKRVTYLNAVSSNKGRNLDAMCFLIGFFLKEHAQSNLILDFEGSMIPGVARFYSGFGAVPENYYHYRYNNLPVPFRWFKR